MTEHQITPEACKRAEEFLGLVCSLAQRFQHYGAQHPRTQETFRELEELTAKLRGLLPSDRLVVGYTDKRFYLENVPLARHNRQTHLLRESLRRRDLGGFILSLGFTGPPTGFLSLITREPAPDEALPAGFRWLTKEERERAGTIEDDGSHVLLQLDNSRINVELYDRALTTVSAFFFECERTVSGDILPVVEMGRTLVDEVLDRPREILPRATVPYYAEFSTFHAVNTCLYLVAVARSVVSDRRLLGHLATAALVHDVGEALIPRAILYKGEALTPPEARRIMEHPIRGVEILQGIPGVHPLVISATFGHHIKPNGEGYPEVGSSYEPGPFTKLLQVVDIFAALVAFRPHKRAITAPEAFTQIYTDPGLEALKPYADLLVQALGFHPPGSRVWLEDGRLAVVTDHPDADPLRAVVRLLERGEEGRASLGDALHAVAGDVPWFTPPRGAPAVMRALSPLEDLDVTSELACPEVLSGARG